MFLCASALESARILLNSRSRQFPNGLANSSDQVGRNVMDHIKWGGADGDFDGWTDKQVIGNRPNGIYIPRFAQCRDQTPRLRPRLRLPGAARRGRDGRSASAPRASASSLKRQLSELGPWGLNLNGFGEMLPRAENRCTLHPEPGRRVGRPGAAHRRALGTQRTRDSQAHDGQRGRDARGGRCADVSIRARASARPATTNHEMGTARMGRDRRTSVLDRLNQAWDVPNLFVTDGACMASSGNQNPSLTYMALTARAAHYAAEALKRGDL